VLLSTQGGVTYLTPPRSSEVSPAHGSLARASLPLAATNGPRSRQIGASVARSLLV